MPKCNDCGIELVDRYHTGMFQHPIDNPDACRPPSHWQAWAEYVRYQQAMEEFEFVISQWETLIGRWSIMETYRKRSYLFE